MKQIRRTRKRFEENASQKNGVLRNSGITLVALVVTIVVLLILAGVTITMLFSDNGIITQAQRAANQWKNAEQADQEGLANLTDQISEALGEDISSLAKLIETNDYVKENTKVTDRNGETLTVPKDFKVIADGGEVKKGVVIEDKIGNQFVWIPVPDPTTMYEVIDEQKVGKLYDFSETGVTPIGHSLKGSREPNILTTIDAVTGDSEKGIEQLKTVIGLTETTDEEILNAWSSQLQTEFDEMIASVEKYKGFYIGRYETGNLAANTTTIPVVKRGQTEISNVNWYYQYQNSKKIAEENSAVKSTMIWGCQWDRTMQWLVESGGKTYEELRSGKGGNYYDTTFEYTDENGVTKTKVAAQRVKIPTGSTEYTKANNIYDMAGNVCDWTMEAATFKTNSQQVRIVRRRILYTWWVY